MTTGYKSMKKTLLAVVIGLVILASFDQIAFAGPLEQSSGPALAISEARVKAGKPASIKLSYSSQGNSISSIVFSIDIDTSTLYFDPADANKDGIPDCIQPSTPAGFSTIITYDANDTDGELDVMIADLVPDLSEIPDGELLRITFQTKKSTISQKSPLVFSLEPPISFGSTDGTSVPGSGSNGVVWIEGVAAPTPTFKPSKIPTLIPTVPVTRTPTAASNTLPSAVTVTEIFPTPTPLVDQTQTVGDVTTTLSPEKTAAEIESATTGTNQNTVEPTITLPAIRTENDTPSGVNFSYQVWIVLLVGIIFGGIVGVGIFAVWRNKDKQK